MIPVVAELVLTDYSVIGRDIPSERRVVRSRRMNHDTLGYHSVVVLVAIIIL